MNGYTIFSLYFCVLFFYMWMFVPLYVVWGAMGASCFILVEVFGHNPRNVRAVNCLWEICIFASSYDENADDDDDDDFSVNVSEWVCVYER